MSNTHIFDYLDYYVELPNPPHYAVMLTGPWGIGKSFNVRRYIRRLEERGKKIAYVSLYGLKTADDIASCLLVALIPRQESKLVQLGSQLGRAILPKYMSGSGEATIKWLPDTFCDLLILDDLERAVMSPVEVLGFVNTFIEHEGRRVVIVANEAEVKDIENYRRVREKVVGMTFELVEDTDAALNHFLAMITDQEAQNFLKSVTDVVKQVFAQSQTQNLRLLDQSLQSWARVFKVIDPELKRKHAGLLSAFKLFLAFSLEFRCGRIARESLTSRTGQIVAGRIGVGDKKENCGNALSKAQERYDRIPLHDSVLTDAVLTQILCDGRIDAAAINESLSVSGMFVSPEDEPSWRKVWHGFLRDASEFEEAFEKMEKEFANRHFEEPGVVLHVLGLRLWGVKLGELSKTEQEVISEGKSYIDDLRRGGRLRRIGQTGFNDFSHGLAFHEARTPAFQAIYHYFVEQSKLAYQDKWPIIAQELLADMSCDAEAFYSRICWSSGSTAPDCAEDAILSKLSPALFVEHLITCPPLAQRTVLEALKRRYETGGLVGNLAAERAWLLNVDQELTKRLPKLPRIRQYSLSKDWERLLGEALRIAKSRADEQAS